MKLWIAPMVGLTTFNFRNVYTAHFRGAERAVSPFLTLVKGKKVKLSHLKDVLPEHNHTIDLVPQIIGNNSDLFTLMENQLFEMGYQEVNWNLGCPIERIAKGKRGSGLLPHPELIDAFLEKIFSSTKASISIKTRLGYHSPDELAPLIPIFNRYPITSITIHPRIGTQLYDGHCNLEKFEEYAPLLDTKVIFNGDIIYPNQFYNLQHRFPFVQEWMIGRGLLYNPFITEIISSPSHFNKEYCRQQFTAFSLALMNTYKHASKYERFYLNKMKEFWSYFASMFVNGEDLFITLKRCNSIVELENQIKYICEVEEFQDALFL